ncbi:MAG: hypothetical protein LC792_07995, partial [Actinobacteria bacterium]|nr:hypothetical protein [Actinomycetota bacterium]
MSRRAVAVAAAGAGVLVIMVAGAVGRHGGGGSPTTTDPTALEGWRPMSPAPLEGRTANPVWTGREMLVWGGSSCTGNPCRSPNVQALGDGAAYDPASDTWRRIAASPLTPRTASTQVWTGKELLVWGGDAGTQSLADGAAYDPATGRWR